MGETRKLWIDGPAGHIEAALRTACPARGAAVVAHPHPQHGGTLHNPVIFHTERELNRIDLTTLRFNFRGVGSSAGEFDDGNGEVDDLAATVSWLRGIALRVPQLVVGYSFGSWCGLRHAANDPSVAGVIAIGLPLRHYDFSALNGFDRPIAVIQGSADEFGSPDEVREWLTLRGAPGKLSVVDNAPHLFPGQAAEVGKLVAAAAQEILG